MSDFILTNPMPTVISGQIGMNILQIDTVGIPIEEPPAPTGMILWTRPLSLTMFSDTACTNPIIPIDGTAVNGWQDQSGNGNHLIKGLTTNAPSYKGFLQGTNDALYFNGVNNLMRCDAIASLMSGTDKAITIAMAYKDDSADGDGGQCLWGFGNSGNDTPFCYESGSWNSATTFVAKVGDDGSNATPSLDFAPDNNLHVLVIRINGTTVDAWLDGVAEIVAAGLNVNATTLNTFAIANLFRTVAASLWFKGWIGEVMIWNDARNDGEIAVINAFLTWEWGV